MVVIRFEQCGQRGPRFGNDSGTGFAIERRKKSPAAGVGKRRGSLGPETDHSVSLKTLNRITADPARSFPVRFVLLMGRPGKRKAMGHRMRRAKSTSSRLHFIPKDETKILNCRLMPWAAVARRSKRRMSRIAKGLRTRCYSH